MMFHATSSRRAIATIFRDRNISGGLKNSAQSGADPPIPMRTARWCVSAAGGATCDLSSLVNNYPAGLAGGGFSAIRGPP